ncbi:MAG TPA: glycosyltransferase [Rhodopila sp.]|nr:glycosyltransferase [Rhodopila sp.]
MPVGTGSPADAPVRTAIPRASPLLIVADRGRIPAASGDTGVLFVTDEIFLPHRNGSSQIYTQVAQAYASAGWRTHCLSFYRDPAEVETPETIAAYREAFDCTLLAPGWNLGGTTTGRIGMGIREANRWLTGNVFASHKLLAARHQAFQASLLTVVQEQRIAEIYFHKPHTMLLLEPLLGRLRPARFVLDLHDDFVARTEHYAAAYKSLFASLPWRDILRQHRRMYLRHRLGRTDTARSRRHELALLTRSDEVRTASDAEYQRYVQFPALTRRVRHVPWRIIQPADTAHRSNGARPFHAGFIGADSVMNLDAVIHLRDRILPRVRTLQPDFRMLIAGTLSRNVGPLLKGVANVEVWPDLPDVARFYDAIGVAAIPLRFGTGVSVKAIEALGYGCPVVTTPVGVRGIAGSLLRPDLVDITDDPSAFAATLVRRATAPLPRTDGASRPEGSFPEGSFPEGSFPEGSSPEGPSPQGPSTPSPALALPKVNACAT